MKISTVQSYSVHVIDGVIKFGVIWPYRLKNYNVLVLKKDVEIFLKTHLEVKLNF